MYEDLERDYYLVGTWEYWGGEEIPKTKYLYLECCSITLRGEERDDNEITERHLTLKQHWEIIYSSSFFPFFCV